MSKKQMGVYKITSPTGRVYIGSAVNIQKRFNSYKNLDCKCQTRLYRSLKKYGAGAHNFEVVVECERPELRKLEAFYGIQFKVLGHYGLNCVLPKIDDTNPTMRESVKKKIANANKGKVRSNETKEKLRNANTGKKHSSETISKMSRSSPRRKPTKAQLESMLEKRIKIVLNTETGIFYNGTKDACESLGIKRSTLIAKLSGQNKNNTSLIYV